MKLHLLAFLRRGLPGATLAAAATLSSCSTPFLATSSYSESATRQTAAMAPAALGTGWGEARESRVASTEFERAHARPDGVGDVRYDGGNWFERPDAVKNFRGRVEMAGGRVSVGIKDPQRGGWFDAVERNGRTYIKGEEGARYEIVVRNLTRTRIEAVVSVDGLDVLDGRTASFSKRGYIIEPRGAMTIPGWRTSSDSVAAFRFAAVADSYAAKKHGDTRNVGVIGVAVFTPKTPPMRVFAEPPPPDRQPNPFPGERWARTPQG